LFLADIRKYREERLAGTGLTPVFPLFGDASATPQLAREMMAGGLCARITCVDPKQLDRRFAGREFDAALLEDLPAGADPCGERSAQRLSKDISQFDSFGQHRSELVGIEHFTTPNEFQPAGGFVGFLNDDAEFRDEFPSGARIAGAPIIRRHGCCASGKLGSD